MRTPKWTVNELKEAVSNSESIAGCMRTLGVREAGGGGYLAIKKAIREHNIDTSHFKGQGHLRGIRKTTGAEIETVFQYGYVNRALLKRYILIGKKIEYKCSICGLLPEWNGKPLTLALDHINGDNNDNQIENLRFLCPNCHSQTETYCGRKHKSEGYFCLKCGKSITRGSHSGMCVKCVKKRNSEIGQLDEV